MRKPNIKTTVIHSKNNSAWNIVGTKLGAKYKIARVPYIASEDKLVNEANKIEAHGHAEFMSYCFNHSEDISVDDLTIAKTIPKPKPFESNGYSHIKFGLPRHYAVNFGAERRMELNTEAIRRHNKIHSTTLYYGYDFYSSDGNSDYWNNHTYFAAPVQVLTVPDFLARTDKYFSTPIPEPKPAESHEYPHMKYGLPKYYAVHFGGEQRVELKTKAVNRYNKIYNTNWNGDFKFYGFDVKDDCWNWIVDFKEPVTLLTVIRFLALTEPHFNPKQPNITDN